MQARFLGPELFKNIADPVPVWLVWAEDSPEPQAVTQVAKQGGASFNRRVVVGAAVLAVGVAAGIGWYAMRHDTGATPKAGTSADVTKSIAILPFANIGDDKDTAYFADGVHEDLLTQLALLGELKVVSRTSVMEYRDTKKNVRQIGSELGVAALVEGSVRRAGNRVRVTAQLVDASTDKHLWAKSYDRDLGDIFAIQSELATEIAGSLRIALSPEDQKRIARKPTENLEAYDLWVRYQDLLNRSIGSIRGIAQIQERIALLAKAVELDPKFGLAWGRLAAEHARAYERRSGYNFDHTPARLAQASSAMDRALALLPDDPKIRIDQGLYYALALSNLTRAAAAYESVLANAPNNLEALNGLSDVRRRQQRYGEQVMLLERSRAIDGRNPMTLDRLANVYLDFRQFDRAQALRKQVVDLRPNDVDINAAYYLYEYWRTGSWDLYDRWRATLSKGVELQSVRVRNVEYDRAIARRDFEDVIRLIDVDSDDYRGMTRPDWNAEKNVLKSLAFLARGEKATALEYARSAARLLERLVMEPAADDNTWYFKALAHAVLGERRAALAAGEQFVAWAARENVQVNVDRYLLAAVLSLLGDANGAIGELRRLLKLPGVRIHEIRVDGALYALWDNPQFQDLVNDPSSNAPIPFDRPRMEAAKQ